MQCPKCDSELAAADAKGVRTCAWCGTTYTDRPTKLAQLQAMLVAGDHVGALRMAARFPQLGAQKAAITRAWDAHQNPSMYRQMGKDPAALVQAGVQAMLERWPLPTGGAQ